MNASMADGASERLDAQIADALFGQPGMSKMDVTNRLRELRGAGAPLLADAGIPVSLSPTGEPNTARNQLTETAQALELAALLGVAAEYQRWIEFHSAGNGDYDDFRRKDALAYSQEVQS